MCINWYFDRMVPDLPLPTYGKGTQLVLFTNVKDLALLLALLL